VTVNNGKGKIRPGYKQTQRTLGAALWWSGRVEMGKGDRAGAEELWRHVQQLAERTHVAPTSPEVVLRRDVTKPETRRPIWLTAVLRARFVTVLACKVREMKSHDARSLNALVGVT
jgi:hypothetical protein